MEIDTNSPNFDQVDKIYHSLNQLDDKSKQQLFTHPDVVHFSSRLRDIWLYTNQFIGKPGFVHHAGLVAKMCGYAYETKDDRKNFVSRVLKEFGVEGVDWIFVSQKEVFPREVSADLLQLLVPGTGETVVIKKGKTTKYPMVTEKFARTLLAKSNKPIGREYTEFLLAVHDVLYRLTSRENLLRPKNRIKSSESMRRMNDAVSTRFPQYTGREYSIIGGMTNKTVTTKTKGEWAREWKVPAASFNLRDHMTSTGLSATEVLHNSLHAAMEDESERRDAVEIYQEKCRLMEQLLGPARNKTVTRESQTLRAARNSTGNQALPIAATAEAPTATPVRQGPQTIENNNGGRAHTIKTIINYFGVMPPKNEDQQS